MATTARSSAPAVKLSKGATNSVLYGQHPEKVVQVPSQQEVKQAPVVTARI